METDVCDMIRAHVENLSKSVFFPHVVRFMCMSVDFACGCVPSTVDAPFNFLGERKYYPQNHLYWTIGFVTYIISHAHIIVCVRVFDEQIYVYAC